MSNLCGVSVGPFVLGMLPLVVVMYILGWVFYIRKVPKETGMPPSKNKWLDLLNLRKHLWSLIVIIGLISLIYAQFAANEWVRAAMAGMSCGVAAVITDVVAGLAGKVLNSRDWLRIVLMAAAFVLTYFLKVNVVFIILGAALVGAAQTLLARKAGGAE